MLSILLTSLRGRCRPDTHFADREKEAERGQVSRPRSQAGGAGPEAEQAVRPPGRRSHPSSAGRGALASRP